MEYLQAGPCRLGLHCTLLSANVQSLNSDYARDPPACGSALYGQTSTNTRPILHFLSPLVTTCPLQRPYPRPMKVLSDVSGAPDFLPYAEDVYKYFRMLEAASRA